MAREVSVMIKVQPLRAPMPETTAKAAMVLPAHALAEHAVNRVHERRASTHQRVCATSPMTAAVTNTYNSALSAVPMVDARATFLRGSLTRLA